MDSVTLKNFRCFRQEQTARLAPLTLLVGENSTGNTWTALAPLVGDLDHALIFLVQQRLILSRGDIFS